MTKTDRQALAATAWSAIIRVPNYPSRRAQLLAEAPAPAPDVRVWANLTWGVAVQQASDGTYAVALKSGRGVPVDQWCPDRGVTALLDTLFGQGAEIRRVPMPTAAPDEAHFHIRPAVA
jgi:hypothetical protein